MDKASEIAERHQVRGTTLDYVGAHLRARGILLHLEERNRALPGQPVEAFAAINNLLVLSDRADSEMRRLLIAAKLAPETEVKP